MKLPRKALANRNQVSIAPTRRLGIRVIKLPMNIEDQVHIKSLNFQFDLGVLSASFFPLSGISSSLRMEAQKLLEIPRSPHGSLCHWHGGQLVRIPALSLKCSLSPAILELESRRVFWYHQGKKLH